MAMHWDELGSKNGPKGPFFLQAHLYPHQVTWEWSGEGEGTGQPPRHSQPSPQAPVLLHCGGRALGNRGNPQGSLGPQPSQTTAGIHCPAPSRDPLLHKVQTGGLARARGLPTRIQAKGPLSLPPPIFGSEKVSPS